MTRLVVLGLGYTARYYVAHGAKRWDTIAATVRDGASAAALTGEGLGGRGVEVMPFDGAGASERLRAAIRDATALLVSIPPAGSDDPVLRVLGDTLAEARRLRCVVYLSTVGVYGDRDGAWVDETATPQPASARSRARAEAERAWLAYGARQNVPVALLRLAGIYGPGRSALDSLAEGTAKRIVKPGQVFNRIHVADIAQAIDAAFARAASGPFNLCDDEPAPPQDVVAYAARLMGMTPPPEVTFEAARATLPPMALSFYGENKRVGNARLKRELGVTLRYPSYREGLAALAADRTVSRAGAK
ncbi:MAG: NAD-dependent epimerase/dehydratase family protein [Xanthobacteraceae bacterium]|nr:MAG: NAD-dependent epimerase/dehydratase family protein [Xanthobacteraceae bacterium]